MPDRLSHVGSMREAIPRKVRRLPLPYPISRLPRSGVLSFSCALPIARTRFLSLPGVPGCFQASEHPLPPQPGRYYHRAN